MRRQIRKQRAQRMAINLRFSPPVFSTFAIVLERGFSVKHNRAEKLLCLRERLAYVDVSSRMAASRNRTVVCAAGPISESRFSRLRVLIDSLKRVL